MRIYFTKVAGYTEDEVMNMVKKALSGLQSPVLVGVVREKTAAAAIAEIKNCMYDGAGMIDLHISCLKNSDVDPLKTLRRASKLPILALNYNRTFDWQDAGFSEEERKQSFLRAVEAGAAGIDMQGYTFDPASKEGFFGKDQYSFTKGNPREIVTDTAIIAQQCAFIEDIHRRGAEVLLSCHPGIPMDSTQVVELALFLEKRNPDIIKIVTVATSEEELLESFKAMMLLKKEVKTPVTYHASGKHGALSRIINPVLGGHMVFCVDHFNERSTMEQLDLRTAKAAVDSLSLIK